MFRFGKEEKMNKNKMNNQQKTFLLMTIPVLVLFFCFNTLPLIKGVIYSFTNFKGYGNIFSYKNSPQEIMSKT